MNFLGHATVALWESSEPAYVLGAMLPDFASMAGTRVGSVEAWENPGGIAAGVALHHRTDVVFHAAPTFLTLMQGTIDELTLRGVPRGPARAVGHIGVEMLIDGELALEPGLDGAYVAALAASDQIAPEMFRDQSGLARFRALHRRLSAHGTPYDYRNTDTVVMRLRHMLSGRPRLSLDQNSERIARSVLPDVQRTVVQSMSELLTQVRGGLRHI